MRVALAIFLLLGCSAISKMATAQSNSNLDSSFAVLKRAKADTNQVLQFISYSNKYRTQVLNYAKALQSAQAAIFTARKINYLPGLVLGTVAEAYALRDKGDKLQAIEALKYSISVIEANEKFFATTALQKTHISTYTALAEVYATNTQFALAQEVSFKAIKLAEKYQQQYGQCWLSLAIFFSRQKQYTNARKYALEALAFFKEAKAIEDAARAYAFLGSYDVAEKHYEHALLYYDSSFRAYEKVGSKYGMRIAWYNIANIHLLQKNISLANSYIQKTLSITSEQDAISMFHINQLHYNIKAASGNHKEAVIIAQKSVQYALAEKDLKNVEAAYTNLLAGYLAVNDSAKAYQVSVKLNELKDSIYNSELAKQMAIKASTYEYERKQQQNLLLAKENDLIKAKLANEHLMLMALSKEKAINTLQIAQADSLAQWLKKENVLRQQDLQQQKALNYALQQQQLLSASNINNERRLRWYTNGIIALLAILVAIIYTAYRKQRAANVIIQSQASNLAVLMKELHHRVKNNLQMIIAMLRMQGRYQDTDKNVQQILKEVENRLQAVALVHEKLYKQTNVKDLMLGVYLEELLSHLKAQSLEHKPIVTEVIDEVHFVTNLDTAIPIALVVNEIAINAIKYAHPTDGNVLQLRIHIYRKEQDLVLAISDNGQGLPNGFDITESQQIGFRLIRLFAEQLHATVSYHNNNGACYTLAYKRMLV
ncbi:MAG TPA: hypothetical protein DCQ29_00995 [Chitinophagaceae bacterium]|nr:hypothetical protein [Chitinophagaceae bacterium]